MSRFFSRASKRRDGDFIEEDSITQRSLFFSPITQAPVISDMGSMNNWDDVPRHSSLGTTVSEPMWHAIQTGAAICDLIKASPEEVIKVLRDHSIKRLGTFTVPDCDVLLAFGHCYMLTRGSETARDGNFEANWREIIEREAKKRRRAKMFKKGGWDENVKVAAYVVNIKNAAAGRENGLLSPLVHKSQSGATSDELWDFPAIRAVIEYKWVHWAHFYLMVEFGLYLGWLISYTVFMIIYIQENLNGDIDEESGGGVLLRVIAIFFDVLALLFMLPFIRIEWNTLRFYGNRWFQMWNILDLAAYVLQIVISYGHLTGRISDNNPYNTVLAVQCVLLFIKVQYFARVFSEGTSFVELLARVIYRVRWFLAFITLTMVSMALSFSVLYKRDIESADKETDEDFGDVLRSLVTTYAVLLGDFDSGYVFDTTNRFVKGCFFLGFQVVMSITVLNLLIAVMTESYSTIMKDQRIMFNMSRAQVMDELEVALPKGWGPDLKPYCHFIIVEKHEDEAPELSAEMSSPSSLIAGQNALHKDVKELKSTVEELKSVVNNLATKLESKATATSTSQTPYV